MRGMPSPMTIRHAQLDQSVHLDRRQRRSAVPASKLTGSQISLCCLHQPNINRHLRSGVRGQITWNGCTIISLTRLRMNGATMSKWWYANGVDTHSRVQMRMIVGTAQEHSCKEKYCTKASGALTICGQKCDISIQTQKCWPSGREAWKSLPAIQSLDEIYGKNSSPYHVPANVTIRNLANSFLERCSCCIRQLSQPQ